VALAPAITENPAPAKVQAALAVDFSLCTFRRNQEVNNKLHFSTGITMSYFVAIVFRQ
jgi:hypothetical protein